MEGDGRVIAYPPIYEDTNRWGDLVYRVRLSDRTETFLFGDPLPWEEAQARVQEILRYGLRDGRYSARDFYFYPQHHNDVQLPRAVVDGRGLEDSYGQSCFGGVPASGEAIVGLPENFEGSNSKLRMMPCSHSFHEQCIFNWLRVSHICPLCRFPLPTEQQ
ncbi:hypothetical protein C2845_PM17G01510 [Panicum miliaceum]|uniref:RING-type domain-containing protein n=1 Tax=Panicum miliaceum TaxID=4540 RepID=A0A3L6Q0G1_PANMI|nr:hypothetical protein C2845_PM17G01510 [Panicum miliaceum]